MYSFLLTFCYTSFVAHRQMESNTNSTHFKHLDIFALYPLLRIWPRSERKPAGRNLVPIIVGAGYRRRRKKSTTPSLSALLIIFFTRPTRESPRDRCLLIRILPHRLLHLLLFFHGLLQREKPPDKCSRRRRRRPSPGNEETSEGRRYRRRSTVTAPSHGGRKRRGRKRAIEDIPLRRARFAGESLGINPGWKRGWRSLGDPPRSRRSLVIAMSAFCCSALE